MTEPPNPTLDLLLQGGRVIDPANGIDAALDVGICGRTIARVAEHIPAAGAARTVDVSGCTVTPGLIDIHAHVYPFTPRPEGYVIGLNADAHCPASGVTTVVDAGTAGWQDWLDFSEHWIDASRTRILALLNIARRGMLDARSEQEPGDLQPRIAAAVARAFPERIVGIKSAHYWTRPPWDEAHPPWASVDRAVEAGESCGLPVMVDFWPRPPERPYPELILERLRPGDIHTHVFAQQFPVLDEQGRVQAFMFQARERGVILDLGHGAGSFWFRNAARALRDGFAPDTISTDLHMASLNGPAQSMTHIMSKFLSMGMSLPEVIERSTSAPARVIGRPELGTLSAGAEADVAVFRVREGAFGFADCGRARLDGHLKLECALTVRAGEIVYDPGGVSMPPWEQAPAPYWTIPALQP